MNEEMEYMNISQYCLILIKNNLKQFFEVKYKSIIAEEYKSASDSFYDVMFYFTVLKKNIYSIKETSPIIINTVHSIKIFRNKIAHQVPITLRELYRFVDDTQIIIEALNICDQDEIIKIDNTRKEIIKRMAVGDDKKIIIGSNYNAGNDNLNLNSNINKFNSDSDIEMGDYDEDAFPVKNNFNYYDNNGKNYNDFTKVEKKRNNNEKKKENKEEDERKKKIEKNFEVIMKNKDKDNFMTAKKVEF